MAKKRGFFSRLLLLHRMFIRAVVLGTLAYLAYGWGASLVKPITVGLFFPLTGRLGADGTEASQAVRFAIDEINAGGGLLHRKLDVVEVDGASSDDIQSLVKTLVVDDGADVIFGCMRPACRRQLSEILSGYSTLLVYPFHLEGLDGIAEKLGAIAHSEKYVKTSARFPGEDFLHSLYAALVVSTKIGASGEALEVVAPEPESPGPVTRERVSERRVLATGPMPNQDLIPGIRWAMDKFGPRVFLVFNEGLYGRVVEQITENAVIAGKGSVVGRSALDWTRDGDGEAAAKRIAELRPDVLINVAIGSENVALYKTLDILVPRDSRIPNLLLHTGYEELREIGWETLATGYVMSFYDAESETKTNSAFKALFAREYGDAREPDSQFYLAYSSVMVWAAAVKKAKTADADAVLKVLPGVMLDLPSGPERISHKSLHPMLRPLILQVNEQGQFRPLWSAPQPIEPVSTYPFKSKENWEKFLRELYRNWAGSWR